MKKNGNTYRFHAVFRVFIGFFAIFCLLLMERRGITYEGTERGTKLLSAEQTLVNKPLSETAECLLLVNSQNMNSMSARAEYEQMLTDMRISYQVQDVRAQETILDFDDFRTVVLLLPDVTPLGNQLLSLCDWVQSGGRVLFGMPVEKTHAFSAIQNHLGILDSGYDFKMVPDFRALDTFMLGADRIYTFDDPYEAAMNVGLDDQCILYASTSDERVPLIWSRAYGEGRFVFCNLAYCEKSTRGIYASAYSLLEDVCIYPVINASAFYLDDWPSPVPMGDGQYVKRDYQMDIQEFYSQVWWPDVAELGRKYSIPFTGLIIENYDDETDGEVERNTVISDYSYYGNMLLDEGGELGYHGYNHQPLCGPDFQYSVDLGYHNWTSTDAMAKAMTEVKDFSEGLFPNTKLQVYVPPSNVLSPEGRALIGQRFRNIRAIASCYLPGESGYAQEFEVAEDGVVETPRIISSCILDEYMRLSAFSELNMHLVNSHFMHPDDLLDEDRGAALGWATLKDRLTAYIEWLNRAAPPIRHVTGSGMAAAVQRFSGVSVERTVTDDSIGLRLGGVTDDDYFLVRVNEGRITELEGGTLEHLTGNLYLLHTTGREVRMQRGK